MPHNVVATGINTEAVLGNGQNPPPSNSHPGNLSTADEKIQTQPCWGQMHGIGPDESRWKSGRIKWHPQTPKPNIAWEQIKLWISHVLSPIKPHLHCLLFNPLWSNKAAPYLLKCLPNPFKMPCQAILSAETGVEESTFMITHPSPTYRGKTLKSQGTKSSGWSQSWKMKEAVFKFRFV